MEERGTEGEQTDDQVHVYESTRRCKGDADAMRGTGAGTGAQGLTVEHTRCSTREVAKRTEVG